MIDTDAGIDVFAEALTELEFAYANVPFYRSHVDAAGIAIGEVRSEADWRRLPPTRKQHFREHFPTGVLARGRGLKEPGIELPRSSGRTGDRLTTARSIADRQRRSAAALSVNPLALARANSRKERMGVYGPPNCSDVECANPMRDLADRILPNFPSILALPVAHDLVMTPATMVDQAMREIQEFGATTLIAAGSHTSFLIHEYIKRDLPAPSIRFTFATFTQVTELARAHWRMFFGRAPFVNVYNMTEFGSVAVECPLGQMHLNDGAFFLEVLDEAGSPIEVGAMGELYVTSLGDRLSPHLRYGTGDFFIMRPPCPCGHAWRTVTLEGRRPEFLWASSGQVVTPGAISRTVGAPTGVKLYQVVQQDRLGVDVSLLTTDGYTDAVRSDVHERVQSLFGDLPVTVQPATYLPCEKSGKFLYCRSEVR
jgi:phenylacetate-CoA ligase